MTTKTFQSPTYNYVFDDNDGFFARWGKSYGDNPDFAPNGPEMLDIEVSTICHQGCKFCYKSNTRKGTNMSFETFKNILDKMPTVLQVAFGIGDLNANPDLWKMMEYCRIKGVVPNITINGSELTDYQVTSLAKYCGAVAVSNYNVDICLDAIRRLSDAGLKQINIHQFLSMETLERAWALVNLFIFSDSPTFDLVNAIVFLSAKQKGRGTGYTPVPMHQFKRLITYCTSMGVPIGFDSCSANKYLSTISSNENYEVLSTFVEPCESGLFSSYINVDGLYFPCSFMEGITPYIDVTKVDNFLDEVWNSDINLTWREKLLECNRNCPIYNI